MILFLVFLFNVHFLSDFLMAAEILIEKNKQPLRERVRESAAEPAREPAADSVRDPAAERVREVNTPEDAKRLKGYSVYQKEERAQDKLRRLGLDEVKKTQKELKLKKEKAVQKYRKEKELEEKSLQGVRGIFIEERPDQVDEHRYKGSDYYKSYLKRRKKEEADKEVFRSAYSQQKEKNRKLFSEKVDISEEKELDLSTSIAFKVPWEKRRFSEKNSSSTHSGKDYNSPSNWSPSNNNYNQDPFSGPPPPSSQPPPSYYEPDYQTPFPPGNDYDSLPPPPPFEGGGF